MQLSLLEREKCQILGMHGPVGADRGNFECASPCTLYCSQEAKIGLLLHRPMINFQQVGTRLCSLLLSLQCLISRYGSSWPNGFDLLSLYVRRSTWQAPYRSWTPINSVHPTIQSIQSIYHCLLFPSAAKGTMYHLPQGELVSSLISVGIPHYSCLAPFCGEARPSTKRWAKLVRHSAFCLV
jgi:hypothetical protein